jgi:hypothetical protein
MPDTTTATPPDSFGSILLEASNILTLPEGSRSKALQDLFARVGDNPELRALIQAKLDRVAPGRGQRIVSWLRDFVNAPGWRQWTSQKVTAFFQLPGVRHLVSFFGEDYPVAWKLIVTALALVVAWLHFPTGTNRSGGVEAVLPLPQFMNTVRVQPYFTSRHSGLLILPPQKNVTIDGDLGDWRQEGWFRTAFHSPWAGQYFLEGAMMHDDKALYIGAVVGDPYPMRNSIELPKDNNTEPEVYAGGSIQVRLAVRPVLNTESFDNQIKDPTLKKLTLWYSLPQSKTYLMVSSTLNDGHRTNKEFKIYNDQQQFQGVFRELTDGRTGYKVEYRIPWELLTDDKKNPFPPTGGVSRVCWEVHWSDKDGKVLQGKVTEVVNPLDDRNAYEYAMVWGKAYFQPRE